MVTAKGAAANVMNAPKDVGTAIHVIGCENYENCGKHAQYRHRHPWEAEAEGETQDGEGEDLDSLDEARGGDRDVHAAVPG